MTKMEYLGKIMAMMTYSASKITPISTFVIMTTTLALYTGWDWFITGLITGVIFFATSFGLLKSGLIEHDMKFLYNEKSGIMKKLDEIDKKVERLNKG